MLLFLHLWSQLHSWDDGTLLEETLSVLNDLVRAGKVLYVGWSNVTGWQLQKIIDLNRHFGYQQIVCLQVNQQAVAHVFKNFTLLRPRSSPFYQI